MFAEFPTMQMVRDAWYSRNIELRLVVLEAIDGLFFKVKCKMPALPSLSLSAKTERLAYSCAASCCCLVKADVSDVGKAEILSLDSGRHFFRSPKPAIIYFDHGNYARNLADKTLVGIMKRAKVFNCNATLAVCIPRLDSAERLLGREIKVYNEIWPPHETAHSRKKLLVRLEVTFFHVTRLKKHPRKHRILVDRPVLNSTFSLPNNKLLLLETLIQQINLHGERVTRHVRVEIGKIDIVDDGFIVHWKVELLCQGRGKRCFPRSDEPRNADEKPLAAGRVEVKGRGQKTAARIGAAGGAR